MRWPASRLRRARGLVDVLSARPGGANEADLDIIFVDREVAGNPQHGGTGGPTFPNGVRRDTVPGFRTFFLPADAVSSPRAGRLPQAERRLAGRGRRSR